MREQPIAAPAIEPLEDGIRVRLDLGGLPGGAWKAGITAVIEEADGANPIGRCCTGRRRPTSMRLPDLAIDACRRVTCRLRDDPACVAVELPAPAAP